MNIGEFEKSNVIVSVVPSPTIVKFASDELIFKVSAELSASTGPPEPPIPPIDIVLNESTPTLPLNEVAVTLTTANVVGSIIKICLVPGAVCGNPLAVIWFTTIDWNGLLDEPIVNVPIFGIKLEFIEPSAISKRPFTFTVSVLLTPTLITERLPLPNVTYPFKLICVGAAPILIVLAATPISICDAFVLNIVAVPVDVVVISPPFTAKSPPTVAPPLVVSVPPINPAEELMLPLAVICVNVGESKNEIVNVSS